MAAPSAGRALIVTHVPWEGPHRIADALLAAGFELDHRRPLEGDALPAHDEVAAAVFMGGPMNVDEVERWPGLALEREWIAEAAGRDLPLLGVCLGAQLIARALGAEIRPGRQKELGWAEVEVVDADDPLLGPLAPRSEVLHWHGDVFDLPPSATLLARSAQTAVQAFRAGRAWGLLFHAEADAALAELWLAEPSMREEAESVLGAEATEQIIRRADEQGAAMIERTTPVFERFAELAAGAV